MSERDWQQDWELCQKVAGDESWTIRTTKINHKGDYIELPVAIVDSRGWAVVGAATWFDWDSGKEAPYFEGTDEALEFIINAYRALPYWLQRVKDLECELRQSDLCIDVLRHANRRLRESHDKLREKLSELRAQEAGELKDTRSRRVLARLREELWPQICILHEMTWQIITETEELSGKRFEMELEGGEVDAAGVD